MSARQRRVPGFSRSPGNAEPGWVGSGARAVGEECLGDTARGTQIWSPDGTFETALGPGAGARGRRRRCGTTCSRRVSDVCGRVGVGGVTMADITPRTFRVDTYDGADDVTVSAHGDLDLASVRLLEPALQQAV